MPLIADIHIACLAAGNWAMRGVDPLKEMAPQQVFNVIGAYRKVLDAYEKEAAENLVRGQGREANAR
jgi:hypothetical protein